MNPELRFSQPHPLATLRTAQGAPAWALMLMGALAGALGWGIRGQYGHETGAMIAGLLVALTLTLLACPQAPSLAVARSVAWCTVATGFGGAMTYGQTIGLTQDASLVGHYGAFVWGMLGLAIKGGIWIAFAGAFLGMGLSGIRYRGFELLMVMLGLLILVALGVSWINSPFDPAHRRLPLLYFSDHWRWEPGVELKPRREVWGGLLLALAGWVFYASCVRRDRLTPRLAAWGFVGGALGFPLGQSLQAFHAWNIDLFRHGVLANLDPVLNWWNFMETTFGAVWGGILGLGVASCRPWIRPSIHPEAGHVPAVVEWMLAGAHLTLLMLSEFTDLPWTAPYSDYGLLLGVLPIAAIASGRFWPYWVMFPITLAPIAVKSLRELAEKEPVLISERLGWVVLVVVPLVLALTLANRLARTSMPGTPAATFLRPALATVAWTYFALNTAFFRFPWPWEPWTIRTPNALIFLVCALGLTGLALRRPATPG